MSIHQALPFELRLAPDGSCWFSKWQEANLRIRVGGDEGGAHPALVETLRALVARWDAVRADIEAYLRGLPPEHHVPLEKRTDEGFRAASCGFATERPGFDTLSVKHVDEPARADLTFDTGLPDGYAMYRIHLVAGAPVAVSAFAT